MGSFLLILISLKVNFGSSGGILERLRVFDGTGSLKVAQKAPKRLPNGGSEGLLGTTLGHLGLTWDHFGHPLGSLASILKHFFSKGAPLKNV